jgi:hypothetical protein
MKPAISPTLFAKRTGLGIHLVQKAVKMGDIRSFAFAGRVLIPSDEIERITKQLNPTKETEGHGEDR